MRSSSTSSSSSSSSSAALATVLHLLLLFSSIAVSPALAATSSSPSSDTKPKAPRPCTVRSPTTDRFFDLTSVWAIPPEKDATKKRPKTDQMEKEESWLSKGYDYGVNFTLNVCGPVVEELKDVVGVEEKFWGNVSAFYRKDGKTFSMGNQNAEPIIRGRKLVLNYTDGSPCGSSSSSKSKRSHDLYSDSSSESFDTLPSESYGKYTYAGASDDSDEKDKPKRRKQTIISLLCEMDPLAAKAAFSFVAASEDECTYFFEGRTHAACGTIEKEAQTLSPAGVFGVIFLIAILAYLAGGCVYQRTVMHQRGWRQLPNYPVWASIGGFVRDIIVIFTSSCIRLLPSRRGYHRVSSNGYGRPRSNHSDDENRLIDQLDEEWDD